MGPAFNPRSHVNYRTLRAPAAEFIGTALFVVVGAGSVIANMGGAAGLSIALAHGVGLAVIVTIMMPISGGHINPAVSFGLWLGKQIDAVTLGKYVLAQLLGAIVGALLIKAIFPDSAARSRWKRCSRSFSSARSTGQPSRRKRSASRDSRSVSWCWCARWVAAERSRAP